MQHDKTEASQGGAPDAAPSRRRLLMLGAATVPAALILRPTGAWATTMSQCRQPVPNLAVTRQGDVAHGAITNIRVVDSASQVVRPEFFVAAPNMGFYTSQQLINRQFQGTATDAHLLYIERLLGNPNFGIGQASCTVSIRAILLNRGYVARNN
jgi:hypothetical protein